MHAYIINIMVVLIFLALGRHMLVVLTCGVHDLRTSQLQVHHSGLIMCTVQASEVL